MTQNAYVWPAYTTATNFTPTAPLPPPTPVTSPPVTPHSDEFLYIASKYGKLIADAYLDPKVKKKDAMTMLVKDLVAQNRVIIYPYKKSSLSGKALAEHFHKKPVDYILSGEIPLDSGKYLFVNWGSQSIPNVYRENNFVIVNETGSVHLASNKIKFFERMVEAGVRTPEFTTDISQALTWLEEGSEVLGRNSSGRGGQDIIFGSEDISGFVTKSFWTKYKKKKAEYRIHVFDGKVIDKQRKAVRQKDEDGNPINSSEIDFRIRNLANGFIFVKQDVVPPEDVITQAVNAVKGISLTFGAVDVIWNQYEKKAYVLEVNTAPGLEGSTVFSYVNAINEYKKGVI